MPLSSEREGLANAKAIAFLSQDSSGEIMINERIKGTLLKLKTAVVEGKAPGPAVVQNAYLRL